MTPESSTSPDQHPPRYHRPHQPAAPTRPRDLSYKHACHHNYQQASRCPLSPQRYDTHPPPPRAPSRPPTPPEETAATEETTTRAHHEPWDPPQCDTPTEHPQQACRRKTQPGTQRAEPVTI